MEDSNAPNTVINSVIGASIPTEFASSVIAGVEDGLKQGPISGYPVTGVAVTIIGGKAHAQDSNTQAFQEAGRLAVKDALRKSETTLLEPIAALDVTTPAEFVGTVIGDIHRRRGQIRDMNTHDEQEHIVHATVPLAETFGYATDLRSMTQGRAHFVLEPQGYAEAPISVVNQQVTWRHGK